MLMTSEACSGAGKPKDKPTDSPKTAAPGQPKDNSTPIYRGGVVPGLGDRRAVVGEHHRKVGPCGWQGQVPTGTVNTTVTTTTASSTKRRSDSTAARARHQAASGEVKESVMASREVRDALGRPLQRGDRVVGRDTRAQWSGSIAGLSRAGRVLVEPDGDGPLVRMEPTELLRQQLVTQWPVATASGGDRAGGRPKPLRVLDGGERRLGLRDAVEHDSGRIGSVLRLLEGSMVTIAWRGGGTAEVPSFSLRITSPHLSTGGPR